MEQVDVLIVGGGPGGSSCAWQLKKHGFDPIILDRASFPRLKLCAGWITPEVVADLEIDPNSYPHSFLTFEHLHFHIKGMHFKLKSRQHSIRRVEFDAWLLEKSRADIRDHYVKEITRDGDHFVIDDQFRCHYLVGAGGTRCPVYRHLFRELAPRQEHLQAAVLEEEFPSNHDHTDCHLWFFENGLPGYSWFVPKAGGHLNVGIGGMSTKLKKKGDKIRRHWDQLTGSLADRDLAGERDWNPDGYTYYLRNGAGHIRDGNAFIVGDSVGLATRDMCEGIGPAVRSGLLAADAIAKGVKYELSSVGTRSIPNPAGRLLDWAFTRRV